jgi:hypothetical protein
VRNITTLTLLSVLLVLGAGSARAQIIWNPLGPAAITGSSDISTTGTFVDAITPHSISTYGNTAQPSSLTVGDTTFNVGSFSDGTFSLSSTVGIADGSDGNAPDGLNAYQAVGSQPPAPSSTDELNYNELLTHCTFSGGTVTVDMSGLVSGNAYQIQVWNSTGRQTTYTSGLDSVTLTGNDFILGDFIAPLSSTESFTFIQSGSNDLGVISDIALRQVPEPSTYATLALGPGNLQ